MVKQIQVCDSDLSIYYSDLILVLIKCFQTKTYVIQFYLDFKGEACNFFASSGTKYNSTNYVFRPVS